MVEASFGFDLGDDGRRVWRDAMLGRDEMMVLSAATMLCRTMNRRPTLRDLLDMTQKAERDADAANAEKRPVAGEEWRGAARPPAWIFGWAIARFRDKDPRPWPEQQGGYAAQRDAGGGDVYAWDGSNLMPEEDRERYLAQGSKLSSEQLWKLIDGFSVSADSESRITS